MSLKSRRTIERFYIIRNTLLAIIIVFIFFKFAFLPLIHRISKSDLHLFIQSLNTYSSFLNVCITFILVVITGFYAFVTHATFNEMLESRRSGIRPLLWIELENSEINYLEDTDENVRQFPFHIKVSNYGRGPAININIIFIIPTSRKDPKREEYVQTSVSHIGKLLPTGSSFSKSVCLHTEPYVIKDRDNEFLELSVFYEDVERNLYAIHQFYDVMILKASGNICWGICYEAMYFMPFLQRKYMDERSDVSLSYDQSKKYLIYSRKMRHRFSETP